MAVFSLTETLEWFDQQPPHLVLAALGELYQDGHRGLFNDKLVPTTDLQMLGYSGFKRYLLSLYEIDEEFVVRNRNDLENLKAKLLAIKQRQERTQ